MDFLFHEVSEKEKEEIKKQAREVLENFSKQLLRVDKKPESGIERKECERQEGSVNKDESFSKDVMFENALDKDKDFIIAEKKSW